MSDTQQTLVTLTPTMPFNWQRTLDFLDEFPPTQGEYSTSNGVFTRAIMVQGQPLGFRVQAQDGGSTKLDCTIYSAAPLDIVLREAAIDRISFHLSLADDLHPFYAAAEHDLPFKAVVQHLYGLHQVKFATPFENACWAVLTQRTPMPVARKMKQQLISEYGGSINIEGRIYPAFPEAAQVSANVEELTALLHNKQKANYIAALADAFSTVDENWLRKGNYATVEAWLLNIKGIGAWSAMFVLIRGLGRTEQLSIEPALLQAAERLYGPPMNAERIAQQSERYGNLRGYWAYYLRNA